MSDDKYSFESLSSGTGIRGQIREDIEAERRQKKKPARSEDDFRKPGQPRAADSDENLL